MCVHLHGRAQICAGETPERNERWGRKKPAEKEHADISLVQLSLVSIATAPRWWEGFCEDCALLI